MTQATGNDDPQVIATMNKAIALATNDQTALAVELLTNLMAEFPRAAGVRAYLAWFLFRIGRHEEAIEQSRQAVKLAPRSETGSLIHFHILWDTDNRIKALDEMKRFLMIRPSGEYVNIVKEWEPRMGD